MNHNSYSYSADEFDLVDPAVIAEVIEEAESFTRVAPPSLLKRAGNLLMRLIEDVGEGYPKDAFHCGPWF